MQEKRAIVANFRLKLATLMLTLVPLALCAQTLPLSHAGEIHDLAPALAAQSLPVHLRATVSYYAPAQHTLFVQDGSGAVYVKTTHPYPIRRGDLVKIDGITVESYRTAVGADPAIQVLGHSSMTSDTMRSIPTYRELMSGKWDCQQATVRGKVRSALVEHHGSSDQLELEILMSGGIVQVYIQDFTELDPRKITGADLELTGVVGGNFNAQWQLMKGVIYVAGAADVRVVKPPMYNDATLPLTSIDDVTQTYAIEDRSPRVRVRGVVTYYQPGSSVIIQQKGRSLYASTRQIDPVPLGSVVDLVGFASDGGYGPSLGQSEVFPSGYKEEVVPRPVTYAEAMHGTFSDNLVAIQGRVLAQLHTQTSDTLSLLVEDHAVTVVLQNAGPRGWLSSLPIGAEVSVVGICRITPTADWGTPGLTPLLFRIDMRSKDDLNILHDPSWWTVQHLFITLGAVLAGALLVVFWAIILRRRVAQQTEKIEFTMNLERERRRLLEAINSEVLLDQLLLSICRSMESLVPGLTCCCAVTDASLTSKEISVGYSPERVLLEAPLTDTKGNLIGMFVAGGYEIDYLTAEEQEVVIVGAGIANLAVNQRRLFDELNYTSTHDQLTGLPNRRLSDQTLHHALQEAAASGRKIGVAYIDIDDFKQINDQHGHKSGDLYLQEIATRLSSRVRTVDKLARVGGDEFLLIATGLKVVEDAEEWRRRLLSSFDHSFILDNRRVLGSASIGIAVFPDHGSNAEELKRHADIDMYAAKHRKRAEQGNWTPDLSENEIFSPADLSSALEAGNFSLVYQPQFSSRGELRGIEALLRLNDPIFGTVAPQAFIRVAERNDVILALGAWVIRQALADAVSWGFEAHPNLRIVVNVAARQLESPGFAEEVLTALDQAGLKPSSLELEITERTLTRDVAQTMRQLKHLSAAGVSLALDDFGTEHASLNVLHHYPIDTLKIDRSFIMMLHTQPEIQPIVRAIVSLGQALRKRIVAEGVETQADVDMLLSFGEMDLQGYLFSRPIPADQVYGELAQWRAGMLPKNVSTGTTKDSRSDPR